SFAVTGSPFVHVASSRKLNVYVFSSSETSQLSAIPSSISWSWFTRVNPSNTWSNTALDVVSDDIPGCSAGGSSLILTFNTCSSANLSSPSSPSPPELFPELLLLSPPQAASKLLIANMMVIHHDNPFQFLDWLPFF